MIEQQEQDKGVEGCAAQSATATCLEDRRSRSRSPRVRAMQLQSQADQLHNHDSVVDIAGVAKVAFTIAIDDGAPQRFVRQAHTPVRIGRGLDNDVVLDKSGVSIIHLELKPLLPRTGKPSFSIRDLSSNGVGFRVSGKDMLQKLESRVDVEVPSSSCFLHVPLRVNVTPYLPVEAL